MKRRYVVTPPVEEDVFEAAVWYDERREGLGVKFVQAVRKRLDDIAENAQ